MSYADYRRNSPEPATCRLCGWSGVAGEDCDCERMEEERIAAELREDEPPEGKGCFAIHWGAKE